MDELDIVDLRIDERLDISEELLSVVFDPYASDDTLGTSRRPWEVSRTVFPSWMLSLMGVLIAIINHAHQLFTYPNFSLI